jgi:acetyl coenzyme A synthetase (ADP forming)-like protein
MPSDTMAPFDADVVLADGGTVHLRSIEPADADALVAFHESLGDETVYFRFFRYHPHLTGVEVERFTTTDGRDRVAIVAVLHDAIVAVGRYERLGDGSSAEVAFVVADAQQGRGLGTILLEHLAVAARANGITEFVAETLASNRRMIRVFEDAGFAVTATFAGSEVHVRFPIAATEASRAVIEAREHHAEARSIRRLFEPGSVALVGASTKPGTVGDRLLANLLAGGFDGPIFPVHPTAATVQGVAAYPTVAAIPHTVDLAVIAVPAASVPGVIEDCAAKGVAGAVVISAGFGEVGDRATEAAIVRTARANGMRLVGPNCIGILDTATGLNATFVPFPPRPGNVAFMTQSGSLGVALLDRSTRIGLGVSSFASAGNKADVSGNDLLQYWEDDPETAVVLLYLESFGNPRKFSRIARRVSRRKPIVAVKAGRSGAGQRAAASHTAALATSDTAVDALFTQTGVIRVDTLDQLFDVGQLLAHQPLPAGNRVGLVTNGGGLAILASDACEAAGLVVAELAPDVQAALAARLGPHAAVANPVDMLASAGPAVYLDTVRTIAAQPDVDAVIVMFTPATEPTGGIAAAIAEGARDTDKPVLAVLLGVYDAPSGLAPAGARRVPLYSSPEPAVFALARAVRYSTWRARPDGELVVFDDVDPAAARATVSAVLADEPDGRWLTAAETSAVFDAFGISAVTTVAVTTAHQAVTAATKLGYPVVLKADGPAIVHKSDVGGVRLGLKAAAEVADAFGAMAGAIGRAMTGALVQPMVPTGVETIVGAVRDPRFGPLVMFGLGGVATEVLGDRAFRLAPLTDHDADDLLDGIRGAPLLRGYRGTPPVDRDRLRALVLRVAALVDQIPEIAELDLNPVIASAHAVVAVDARIRVAPAPAGADGARRLR